MSHEAEIRELLQRGKPGDALVYLAVALDALEAARLPAAPALDWSVSDAWAPPKDEREFLPARPSKTWVYPLWEHGPELSSADFGWDGSPDTWTKEIGEDMYRAALAAIGDPQPGDTGEWAARRQLAMDLRTVPTRNVLYVKGETIGNQGYTSGDADEEVIVDIPAPTEEQRAWRRQFGEQLGWDQPDWLLPTGGEPIIESFVQGGPLLMFHGYREYLEQIPPAFVARMIAHWADCGYPLDAAIMTADLLRAEDVLDYERAHAHGAAFSKTLPGGRGA